MKPNPCEAQNATPMRTHRDDVVARFSSLNGESCQQSTSDTTPCTILFASRETHQTAGTSGLAGAEPFLAHYDPATDSYYLTLILANATATLRYKSKSGMDISDDWSKWFLLAHGKNGFVPLQNSKMLKCVDGFPPIAQIPRSLLDQPVSTGPAALRPFTINIWAPSPYTDCNGNNTQPGVTMLIYGQLTFTPVRIDTPEDVRGGLFRNSVNQLVYDNGHPGSLSVSYLADAPGAPEDVQTYLAGMLQWTTPQIGVTVPAAAAANPPPGQVWLSWSGSYTGAGDTFLQRRGLAATATYTGLPSGLTDFGCHSAAVQLHSYVNNDDPLVGTVGYEVFFRKDATNHPAVKCCTNDTTSQPSAEPNWFFYYAQANAPAIQFSYVADPKETFGGAWIPSSTAGPFTERIEFYLPAAGTVNCPTQLLSFAALEAHEEEHSTYFHKTIWHAAADAYEASLDVKPPNLANDDWENAQRTTASPPGLCDAQTHPIGPFVPGSYKPCWQWLSEIDARATQNAYLAAAPQDLVLPHEDFAAPGIHFGPNPLSCVEPVPPVP